MTELEAGIRGWTGEWHKAPRPFAWAWAAGAIFGSLVPYGQRTGRCQCPGPARANGDTAALAVIGKDRAPRPGPPGR
jgi:hypothetical protein